MGLGAVFVNQLVKWETKLDEDLDKMLAKAKAANERRYMGMLFPFLLQFPGCRFQVVMNCRCFWTLRVGMVVYCMHQF